MEIEIIEIKLLENQFNKSFGTFARIFNHVLNSFLIEDSISITRPVHSVNILLFYLVSIQLQSQFLVTNHVTNKGWSSNSTELHLLNYIWALYEMKCNNGERTSSPMFREIQTKGFAMFNLWQLQSNNGHKSYIY